MGGFHYSSAAAEPEEPCSKISCVSIPSHTSKLVKLSSNDPLDFSTMVKAGSLSWINYAADDMAKEAASVAKAFGFSEQLVQEMLQGGESYQDNEVELGLMMPAIHIRELEVEIRPVIFLLNHNLILTIHDRRVTRMVNFFRYAESWLSKLPTIMPSIDKKTLILTRLLEVINERNAEQLRLIEDKADDISEALLDPTVHFMATGKYIYAVKHCLILYLNGLWRSLDLLNKLRYGDAELITDNPKVLQRIAILIIHVTKHISLTEHTSTVLVSGTTVLQTLHNNQLLMINNRLLLAMTWMTIIGTAVLVPNTLATIFGFVFSVPIEYLFWSMTTIVLVTAVATVLAYNWVMSKMDLIVSPGEKPVTTR
jgi:magnesium transporter